MSGTKYTLPARDTCGGYTWPDGSRVWPSAGRPGKWAGRWANGVLMRDDDDSVSRFDSAEEAAAALASGGEGPAAVTKAATPGPPSAARSDIPQLADAVTRLLAEVRFLRAVLHDEVSGDQRYEEGRREGLRQALGAVRASYSEEKYADRYHDQRLGVEDLARGALEDAVAAVHALLR